MKKALLILGALAIPAAPAAAAPARKAPARKAPAHVAPVARDWSRTVAATSEGGFRMGNPAAPIKVVEYGSLTCSHCAAFARSGEPQLVAGYVRSGKVSYEFRNFVLNGVDVTASLLARCAGPAGFFPMIANLYATQPQWMQRITGLSEAQKDAIKALPEGPRLARLADLAGLTQVAGRYGLTPVRARLCAANPAGLAALNRLSDAGNALGVPGTPTFFVNGTMVDGITWAEVEPAIRRAGG